MKTIHILIFGILLLYSFGCSGGKKDNSIQTPESDTLISTSSIRNHSNVEALRQKLLSNDSLFELGVGIKLFAMHNGTVVSVNDEHNWPKEATIIFNVLLNDSDQPVLLKEVPISDSGDIDLVYTYYFDELGNTQIISAIISLFDESCSNGVITEKRTFYYLDGTLIHSDYNVSDEEGNILNKERCGYLELPLFGDYKKFADSPVNSFFN